MGGLTGLVTSTFDAVVRPSAFVRAHGTASGAGGVTSRTREGARLVAIYVANLLLYAGPLTLTLASLGYLPEAGSPPPLFVALASVLFVDGGVAWQFAYATAQNCAFLFAGSALALVTFHCGVLFTRCSAGVLQTFHTVTYSAGAYLAGIFSLVWYAETSETLSGTAELLRSAQAEFVYAVIDLTGVALRPLFARPDEFTLARLSPQGELVVAGIVVTLLYFLYSLYLGARINHGASRAMSATVVLVVVVSPVLYVLGSIAFALLTTGMVTTP